MFGPDLSSQWATCHARGAVCNARTPTCVIGCDVPHREDASPRAATAAQVFFGRLRVHDYRRAFSRLASRSGLVFESVGRFPRTSPAMGARRLVTHERGREGEAHARWFGPPAEGKNSLWSAREDPRRKIDARMVSGVTRGRARGGCMAGDGPTTQPAWRFLSCDGGMLHLFGGTTTDDARHRARAACLSFHRASTKTTSRRSRNRFISPRSCTLLASLARCVVIADVVSVPPSRRHRSRGVHPPAALLVASVRILP